MTGAYWVVSLIILRCSVNRFSVIRFNVCRMAMTKLVLQFLSYYHLVYSELCSYQRPGCHVYYSRVVLNLFLVAPSLLN